MTWTQRNGTCIPIRDMTDDHLLAAIAMVRRKCRTVVVNVAWSRASRALSYAEDAPDGAADAARDYAGSVCSEEGLDEILVEANPKFAALVAEARRREIPHD